MRQSADREIAKMQQDMVQKFGPIGFVGISLGNFSVFFPGSQLSVHSEDGLLPIGHGDPARSLKTYTLLHMNLTYDSYNMTHTSSTQ